MNVIPRKRPHASNAARLFKGLAILASLGVLALGALFVALWLDHGNETTLPAPTGPFAVGRAIYDWTDDRTGDAARDTLAPVPGAKRELLVWIWYPSATTPPSATIGDYLPAPLRAELERARGLLDTRLLTRDLSRVHAHSVPDAELSPQRKSYPVAIMRAGASALVAEYSTLAEDLASQGYVVVGFDAPYRTSVVVFPDGRAMRRTPENNPELCEEQPLTRQAGCVNGLLTAWTGDIAFVLDRLERLNAGSNSAESSGKFSGRLDMTRVGVFGHSFGGAAAAQFCHEDSRCKAGIDVDGQPFGSVVQTGLRQPFLFLLSDHGHSNDPETRQIQANIQSIYDRLPPDGRLRIAIRGANHFFFSDDGALLKNHAVLGLLRVLGIAGIDGRRQLAITAYCVHNFFDRYLKGESVTRLGNPSPLYPEIQVSE